MKRWRLSGFLIVLLAVLVLSGCTLIFDLFDDLLNGTDAGDFSLVKASVVGPEGGALTTDQFSLTVPEGAFDSDAELKLFVSKAYKPFGQDSDSNTFLIEGLPLEYAKPLQVQVRYNGTISDESFLAWGTENFVSSLGGMSTTFTLLEAEVSGGYLVGEIPALQEISSASYQASVHGSESKGHRFYVVALSSYVRYLSRNGNFEIHFWVFDLLQGLFSSDDVANLGDCLEKAGQLFLGMGFSYAERTRWPVKVTIRPLGDKYGLYSNSILGHNYGYMEFDSKTMKNSSCVTAGHEFFHLVQSLYDPRWPSFRRAKFKPDHYWLNEATAVWSEKYFGGKGYFPLNFLMNPMAPFLGMEAGAEQNSADYGYGMSAMMETFIQRKPDTDKYNIVEVYERIKAGVDAVTAIMQDDPKLTWWDAFWGAYLGGQIYRMKPVEFLREAVSDTFVVGDTKNISKTFYETFPDLSARLYNIRLEWDKDSPLEATLRVVLSVGNPDTTRLGLCHYGNPNTLDIACEMPLPMEPKDGGASYEFRKRLNDIRAKDHNLFLLVSNTRRAPPNMRTDIAVSANVEFEKPEEPPPPDDGDGDRAFGTIEGVYYGNYLKTNTRSKGDVLFVTSPDKKIVLSIPYEILWEKAEEFVVETGFRFRRGLTSPGVPIGRWRVCGGSSVNNLYVCSGVVTVTEGGTAHVTVGSP